MSNLNDSLQTMTLLVFGIGIVGWLVWSIYGAFWLPDKPQEKVIFEIVGIENSTNATTLTQIHLECIKFCGSEKLSYSSNDKVDKCWEQCATLGKEQ